MSNLKQVLSKLKNNTGNIVEKDVAPVLVDVVKKRIDDDVYSYDPIEYERTNELKESVINTNAEINGNNISVQIKHDTNLINSYSPNQHMSAINGEDSSDIIPYIVHEGKSGKIFGEGVWTEPRPYMDNAREEIESSKMHTKIIKDKLKNIGYKVD